MLRDLFNRNYGMIPQRSWHNYDVYCDFYDIKYRLWTKNLLKLKKIPPNFKHFRKWIKKFMSYKSSVLQKIDEYYNILSDEINANRGNKK
jgi:hypothetical protein